MKNKTVNHINVFERKNMKREKNINKNDEKNISKVSDIIQHSFNDM